MNEKRRKIVFIENIERVDENEIQVHEKGKN